MILCLGSVADDTFIYTVQRLASFGTAIDVLDVAHLALAGRVSGPLAAPEELVISVGWRRYSVGNYDGIFMRMIDLQSFAPTEELGARSAAWQHVLACTLSLLPARVVNRQGRSAGNAAKLYHQVLVASRVGLLTPRSLVTTVPERAVEFVEGCRDGAIIKGASGRKTWVSTVSPPSMGNQFSRLSECPSLIQERITGEDIRVHVAGESCHAEAILSADVDYRRTGRARFSQVQLSPDILDACVRVARCLDLSFVGIDLKRDVRTGELVFLEANSMPCYQVYDRRASGRISAALHHWLTTGS